MKQINWLVNLKITLKEEPCLDADLFWCNSAETFLRPLIYPTVDWTLQAFKHIIRPYFIVL